VKVKERFSYFLYKDAELVSLISWKGELLLKNSLIFTEMPLKTKREEK
jgi:hypothetical protein